MNKYNVTDDEREQQISADREVCKVLAITFGCSLALVVVLYYIAGALL